MKRAASQPARARRAAIAAWLLGMLLCCAVISRATFTTDLSAFLPASPTSEQRVLLDQLRDGVVSRLILVGLEGGDAPARAAISKDMAQRLRADQAFVTVNNGEPVYTEKDQAFLFGNRYLLSPAVTPERFGAAGLRAAIGDSIDLLASPAGMLVKQLLPRDPTGEMVQLFERMNGAGRPTMSNGAWASRDGARALLLAQTRASGSDTDAQQQAMERIRRAFDDAAKKQGAAAVKIVMTGPGVFSVLSRQTIETEVTRLSILSTLIIITLLLIVYRSFTALALGLLPVLSGALAGVVAVSLGFGVVHGITLGFGTTLIGEAVDYSIYLFVQSRQAGADTEGQGQGQGGWVREFWPTIRLGVLTSIAGFASLLFSSFPGLAQLGLYSISGLVAAAAMTRFVLPHLLPEKFRIRDVSRMGGTLVTLARRATVLRLPAIVLIVAACAVVALHRDRLWNTELASLSPVAPADQAIDARLRADMGAPDVRYMAVVSGDSREAVLRSAERVSARLEPLVAEGVLAGFESPSRYLPSLETQRARQASLPAEGLEQRLREATADLPVRPGIFAPFLADAAAAKARAPIDRSDLDGTSLALAVDSLLFRRDARWTAMLPLTAPADAHGMDAAPVRAALAAAGASEALFVDLKAESDRLYGGYLHEALLLSLAGLCAILVLLSWSLRSLSRMVRVLLPLVGAVATVVALLALAGHKLTILHLVGLLLIVAVGSNYALFFSGGKGTGGTGGTGDASMSPRTLTSLVFANLTTVAGFGLLGFSQVPILQAIGITVGPGAVLALLYSATFAARPAA